MQKIMSFSTRFTAIIVVMVLLTFFLVAFPANTAKAASLNPAIPNVCRADSVIAQSDVVSNNQGYGLYTQVYTDHCGTFYAEAIGVVPEGANSGGTVCITFNNTQSCTPAGGGALQGSEYIAFSHITHSASGDAVGDFTNIPGGNLHVDAFYACISSC